MRKWKAGTGLEYWQYLVMDLDDLGYWSIFCQLEAIVNFRRSSYDQEVLFKRAHFTLGIGNGPGKDALKNVSLNLTWIAGRNQWLSRGSSKKNTRYNKHKLNNSIVNNNVQNCFALLDNISSHTNSIANLNKPCVNRSCKFIYKCKSKIYKLQPIFLSRGKVISTSCKMVVQYQIVLFQIVQYQMALHRFTLILQR